MNHLILSNNNFYSYHSKTSDNTFFIVDTSDYIKCYWHKFWKVVNTFPNYGNNIVFLPYDATILSAKVNKVWFQPKGTSVIDWPWRVSRLQFFGELMGILSNSVYEHGINFEKEKFNLLHNVLWW